mmetsp:Transcript_58735/g.174778  ORF Transcript_58735/g.174778 Transcript_58735/m.174778 type:complete len:134 (-) Transcript_58735:217-618(-)
MNHHLLFANLTSVSFLPNTTLRLPGISSNTSSIFGDYYPILRDSGGDFLPQGEDPNYLDIAPYGGTLVLFRSDMVPHEVLDTQAERVAIVGWYNRAVTASDIGELASDSDKMRAGMLLASAALVTGGLISLLT